MAIAGLGALASLRMRPSSAQAGVHAMIFRVAAVGIAAGCVAVAVWVAAPAETHARGAGFGGGRPMAAPGGGLHGSFRARVMRPVAPVAAPAVPRPGVAVGGAAARVLSGARVRHRRFFGAGWPLGVWGDAPWYPDGYDDAGIPAEPPASGSAPAYSYPVYPPPDTPVVRERVIYLIPFRPGCGTQTYRVRSAHGGMRSINVVRC